MPPKTKVNKEDILLAAIDMVKKGEDLNARALAKRIGCSTQPIFSNYSSMDDLKTDLIERANLIYEGYIKNAILDESLPKYKASGMGYIRFAKEEPKLFSLLFMRDRSSEVLPSLSQTESEIEPIINIIMENLKIDKKAAFDFHISMWIFVHGIATMIATGYLMWDEETVSKALTDEYLAKKQMTVTKKGD